MATTADYLKLYAAAKFSVKILAKELKSRDALPSEDESFVEDGAANTVVRVKREVSESKDVNREVIEIEDDLKREPTRNVVALGGTVLPDPVRI